MYFPAGFDLERSIELCGLTDQAYAQFEAFLKGNAWKLPEGYTLVKELTCLKPAGKNTVTISGYFDAGLRGVRRAGGKDAQAVPMGFLARRKGSEYLIFRGTVTDQEWLQDLRMRLVPYLLPNFGKVHDGFLEIYCLFRELIMETLNVMDPDCRLFIAGHSLGGALATIALPDIGARTGRKAVELYTYGSPRIGDNAFVTAFNSRYCEKSFRIVNTSDMVGLVPPPAPIAGALGGYFSHVDTPIGFTVQAEDVVKNHDIKTYLSALQDSRVEKGILDKLKNWFARRQPAR
jgi:triacylglycerol lipase